MIFDLKSGSRRRVVQVVFGFLAFIFFVSFVGFGVGSGVTGGLFDALGIGGNNSGSAPQYEQQIEDAQSAVDQNPGSGTAYADLIAAYYTSGSSGVSTDPQTGQRSISEGARSDLEHAAQAWADYTATKPEKPSVTAAASAVQVFFLLGDAGGAAEAQAIVADSQRTAASYGQLALYLYANGKIKAGDAAAKKSVAAADPSQREQTRKNLEQIRKQAIKQQRQIEQQAQQGAGAAGGQGLEDPFGALGGAPSTTAPPVTSTP